MLVDYLSQIVKGNCYGLKPSYDGPTSKSLESVPLPASACFKLCLIGKLMLLKFSNYIPVPIFVIMP